MVALLSRWTTLEDVELRDLGHPQGTLPGSCLAHLARLPGLRKVIITTLASCRAADVEPLTRLAHLEQLGLTRSAPSDAGVARFGSLPTLQVLSLPQTELTEPTLAELARIPGLGSLDFDGSRLPAGGLRALAGLTRLTYLNVAVDGLAGQPNAHHLIHRVRPRFGDDDLDALERVPLRDLMLMGMDATDAGVGRLLRSHSFVGLTLGGRGITDASIPLLAQQTGLRGLVLADTSITDAGLAQLKALGGLRTLSLIDNARLTDIGVSGLAAFPALSYLTIRQPAVRSATLDAIRAARSKAPPSTSSSHQRRERANMAYSDFTINQLTQRFGLTIRASASLFAATAEADLPPHLATSLERYVPLALNLNTEKAKSELVIAPVLLELKLRYPDQLSLFSGLDFPVDSAAGLIGRCDFLVARNPQQLALIAPVCVVVEAKNENMIAGIPQALAEMVAARRFNEQAGTPITPIYGVVTTGMLWRFLKLEGDVAHVDAVEYPIQSPARIFGILTVIALGEPGGSED